MRRRPVAKSQEKPAVRAAETIVPLRRKLSPTQEAERIVGEMERQLRESVGTEWGRFEQAITAFVGVAALLRTLIEVVDRRLPADLR